MLTILDRCAVAAKGNAMHEAEALGREVPACLGRTSWKRKANPGHVGVRLLPSKTRRGETDTSP
jgi:hypothetical protein